MNTPHKPRFPGYSIRLLQGRTGVLPYIASAFLVAVVASFNVAASRWIPDSGVPLLFLTAVLASAATFGFWPGIMAAILAFGSYNFLFVEPLYTLRVNNFADVLSLALFLVAASLTGWLAGRLRDEADAANRRAAQLDVLARFTARLGDCSSTPSVYNALINNIAAITGQDVVVMGQDGTAFVPIETTAPGIQLDDFGLQACERAFRNGAVQPATAWGWQGSHFGFYPISVDGIVHAVVGARFPQVDRLRAAEIEQTMQTMIAQSVATLNRIDQAAKVEAARVLANQESLRSTLLLSLSHDLRTPLATILGSVTSLRQLGQALPKAAREDLLLATEEETQRLSRYVEDLLTMTRLNTGLKPLLDWVDPADILDSAVVRAGHAHAGTEFSIHIKSVPKLIHCDAALLEQALFNVLDNAAKFSKPRSAIQINVQEDTGMLTFTVENKGPAIPVADQAHIFDPLFRGSDKTKPGTGLGLAIVKGIMTLLEGTVTLQSPLGKDGGTRFCLTVPTSRVVSN